MSNLVLAQLISSRIAHDLITPIGAIANGLELITLPDIENPHQQQITQLLERSIESATVKLAYFRSCYGANKSFLKGKEQPFQVCQNLLKLKNIALTWNESHFATVLQAPTWRRLAMTLIGILDEFMPRGGQVSLDLIGDSAPCLVLSGEGPMMLPRPEILAVIEQGVEPSLADATPMTLPGIIAQYLLQELEVGAKIEHQSAYNKLQFEISPLIYIKTPVI